MIKYTDDDAKLYVVDIARLSPIELRILKAIQDSPVVFYVCGSRAFGLATEESDHDFFCSDSEDAREAIYRLGFHRSDSYSSTDIREEVSGGERVRIHIVFTSDVDRRIGIQNILIADIYGYLTVKDSRTRGNLWKAFEQCYELGRSAYVGAKERT